MSYTLAPLTNAQNADTKNTKMKTKKGKPAAMLIPGIARVTKQGCYGTKTNPQQCYCAICQGIIPKGEICIKGLRWVHIHCFQNLLANLPEELDKYLFTRSAEAI
jgi:hypothetical protein